MVLLTIVAQKNGETIYFDEPFPEVHYMKLLSCSLYNSWYNLKEESKVYLVPDDVKQRPKEETIMPGHYDVDNMMKTISNLFEKYQLKGLSAEAFTPIGQLIIKNLSGKQILLEKKLSDFLGLGNRQLEIMTFAKRLKQPTAYFIHCNLIGRHQNFLNNKKTDVLAKFDVKGKPYEKVTYETSPQQPFRDCSTDAHVKSIAVSVRDEDGNLFDFNGLRLEFELEIN